MRIRVFQQTPFVMNCFLVDHQGEAIVVDPGEASPALLDALDGLTLRMIVNTHCHVDHCGGNAGLKEATGAPLACHKADLPLLRSMEHQCMMFGVSFPQSPDPDRFLEENDEIALGDERLRVAHVPGHSPGHIALVGPDFVIAGDALFAGSIGRTDLPGGDHSQLLASIREKLLTLPDDTTVYSGHGPSTTVGRERDANPFLRGR